METGYLCETKMSEFDRFLPHLKQINHRYPVFDLCTGVRGSEQKHAFPLENVGSGVTLGSDLQGDA